MARSKNDRKPPKRFLSVGPVTSRDNTGPTPRQPNLRGIMKQRVAILTRRRERDAEEIQRLNAAISALGTRR